MLQPAPPPATAPAHRPKARATLALPLSLLTLALAGCSGIGLFERRGAPTEPSVAAVFGPGTEVQRPQPRPGSRPGSSVGSSPGTAQMAAAAPLRPQGRSADALDTTTAAERAAAAATPRSSATALGETLAGLGAPTEPGFWLRTGLVDRARPGRVEAASGAGVAVELRPSGNAPGSGSQISLAAIRALGVPLNQLVALRVFTTD